MEKPQIKLISTGVPYVAIFIGLYILRSAWAAILLYHFGIALFLIADDKGRSLKKIRSGCNPIITIASGAVCVLIVWMNMVCLVLVSQLRHARLVQAQALLLQARYL